MNFQQLRFVREAVRQNMNLTEVANVLYTSQSGVSKQIKDLEDELGVDIFIRRGKRLTGLTEPGKEVHQLIERMLLDAENLRRVARQFADQDNGHLVVATTHTQARYVLPGPVTQLRRQFPQVNIGLHQGSPDQVAKMLIDETADVGLATESLSQFEELVTLPAYEWQHVLVMRAEHPLAQLERIDLEHLAAQPLVSYHPSFTGRTRIDRAFAQRQIKPNIVLEAIDSDVIKTYVRLGLGVGIVAEMAVREDPPGGELVSRPLGHLLGQNVARIAFKRGAYLRNYVYSFAELLSDRLNRTLLQRAMSGEASDYDL